MHPRSNAMLIGLAGFGKQSLTKFASFMLELKYETLRIKKDFRVRDFREILKDMLIRAGSRNEKITFLMTDTQIINDEFLENINNFLNTGEVTNIYTKEDKDAIDEEMMVVLE
jgi:dynein heavy chain, axonemal